VTLGTIIAQLAYNAVRVINRLPYVNWIVTVINQRRLPPVLLTTLQITPPVHHHGREPPRWMDTKVSNSNSNLQGH